MSQISEKHKQLNENGIGCCSVPMWSMGIPAGFCDRPAYGKQIPKEKWPFGDLQYDGYVPGLACPGHGGPRTRVFKDGNKWCAVYPDFINIQESKCAFGDDPEQARKALTGYEYY